MAEISYNVSMFVWLNERGYNDRNYKRKYIWLLHAIEVGECTGNGRIGINLTNTILMGFMKKGTNTFYMVT